MNALRRVLSTIFCNVYAVGAICIALWVIAPHLSEAGKQMVSFAIINLLLAASINLLTGMAGQISLGQAAFMGIAAYTSVLTVKAGILPLWVSIPAGTALAAAVGALLSIPAGRVREFYLAMMTLAFGMIFGLRSTVLHLFMTGSLAATIGVLLFVAVAIDQPFLGDVAVPPAPIQRVLDDFSR